MTILLKNGTVYLDYGFVVNDLLISEGRVFVFDGSHITIDKTVDCSGKIIIPGFTDVHVHLREPGFSYKETIRTGTMAAARGGYTTIFSMPNLKPAPSTMENLDVQRRIIDKDAFVHVIPYGTITMNQDGRSRLSDMEALAPHVCAFTDDGKGVQTGELMREAMLTARSLGKIIVAHCEDESLLTGGSIHDGRYAAAHGMKGICSESEWKQVERDVQLAAETGCPYHVCHVSTKESVEIIRRAKASGVDVTCETAPHYLTLCDMDLRDEGRFKMNPPLRDAADRAALIRGIQDGTVDMIATDHAPHSIEEKAKGLEGSPFGIVGLETAFPVLYSKLVLEEKAVTLEKLIDLLAAAPRRRFGLSEAVIRDGSEADLTIIDTEKEFTIEPDTFATLGRATPFSGWHVRGSVDMTIVNGETVWERNKK
jgi:dihydroorotase